METYEVVRFYQNENKCSTILQSGLTLEEARKFVDDPEMSSKTARKPKGCEGDPAMIERWNNKNKHWFVGFRKS